jgi:hypothetical protein
MGTKHSVTRMKQVAQAKRDVSRWNMHVNKLQDCIANKVLRRML